MILLERIDDKNVDVLCKIIVLARSLSESPITINALSVIPWNSFSTYAYWKQLSYRSSFPPAIITMTVLEFSLYCW